MYNLNGIQSTFNSIAFHQWLYPLTGKRRNELFWDTVGHLDHCRPTANDLEMIALSLLRLVEGAI